MLTHVNNTGMNLLTHEAISDLGLFPLATSFEVKLWNQRI